MQNTTSPQAFSAPKHDQAARDFVAAATDYSKVGLDCFNTCVTRFDRDVVLGMEKACLGGCLTVNLQMFTHYANQYSTAKQFM